MIKRVGLIAAGAVVGFAMAFGSANAVTVTADTILQAPKELTAPTTNSAGFRLNYVGNDLVDGIPPNSRTPWEGTAYENTGQYNSVEAGGFASYVYQTLQTEFFLMWGSPDSYNKLTFYDAIGGVIATILGNDGSIVPPGTAGLGFVNVLISDFEEGFYSVKLESIGSDAFEYALVNPVPLPPALLLFGSAMAGIGFLSRKRKKDEPSLV